MRWYDMQRDMAVRLVDGGGPAPVFVRAPAGGLSGRRFDVYRNNVMAGLTRAVMDNFPVVTQLVGEPFMRAMAADYVRFEQPASPVLIAYGGTFATTVEKFAMAANLPYLADVARIEWAWLEAYHAADAAPLTIDALAELAPDRMAGVKLGLHPSLRLLHSPFPVASIWRAHQGEAVVEALSGIGQHEEYVVVCRPRLYVEVQIVGPADYEFVRVLAGGATLGDALSAVGESDPRFDAAAAVTLLFQTGLVVAVYDSHEPV